MLSEVKLPSSTRLGFLLSNTAIAELLLAFGVDGELGLCLLSVRFVAALAFIKIARTMRNHGWELPYHPLQTVAVAVFSGLSFSFYVFFIPFVGSSVLKIHIYAAFSPVVLAVFFLYVRCAGCDPADPGVHQSKRAARAKQRAALKAKDLLLSNIDHTHDESERKAQNLEASGSSTCARWLWLPFACCKKDDSAKRNAGEQLLYCSICEAEISKNSKHCRACDKCVHEFDHHCRWLNNCVGKRNYRTFVSLMVACLLLLVIVWSTGIGVLVRCFSQKTSFEEEIIRRLGTSFSLVPYIIVVVLLSLLAMLGTIPLCQLFFFHLILIHKGITTYDYILAVREQGLEHDVAEGYGFNSLTSSPASSNATGVSGYSSAGALGLHRGVFCTPPRMFVEHQQKVLSFSGDLEANSPAKIEKKGVGAAKAQPHKKASVGINPWKLARLNAEEAAKVAAQARAASTNIIRPILRDSKGSFQVTETEADSSLESSRNVSGEITIAGNRWNHHRRKHHDLAYLTGKERWLLMKDRRGKSNITLNNSTTRVGTLLTANGSPQSMVLPLPLEARNGFRCSPSRFSGEMRASYPGSPYPGSQLASPELTFQGSPELQTIVPPSISALIIEKPAAPVVKEVSNVNGKFDILLQRSDSIDGYEASAGESGDENTTRQLHLQGLVQTLKKSNLDTSVVTPNEKVAVWEDGSQENIVKPRTSSGSRSLGSRGSRSFRGESNGGRTESSSGSRAEANILKHIRKERSELGDRLAVSPDDSAGSFPSPFTSPRLDSLEVPKLAIATNGRTSNSSQGIPLALDEAPVISSTKKLMESLTTGKKTISTKVADGVFNSEPIA